MAGLVSPTVAVMRESAPPQEDDDEQTVVLNSDEPQTPDKPAVVIEFPDGSVTINTNPANATGSLRDEKFNANLAEKLGESYLNNLAEELLMGIEEDERSRQDWLDERAEGIKLLALKIEKPSGAQGGASAGVDNTSRSRHTLLLEAALRFQANARSELLPTDGPVKVEDEDGNDTPAEDELAQLLEDDMNYYLTNVASEYYPDTDRMLLWTAVGGSGFKKVYRCPIRRRPVCESVNAEDLVVSNMATDLQNADRVTFKSRMRQSVMKRMKYLEVYRDVELTEPGYLPQSVVEEQKEQITGVRQSTRPEDMPFEILECYCMIDVEGDEHMDGKKASGLPRPYKVTIEKTSRVILEIRRNWRKDDEMERAREVFVKFPFVPGFGFYDLGLIHIAGNPTTAATALLRIMIDSGIFGNFPGGLVAKGSDKQNTTDINVPPGGFAPIDTSMAPDGDIRKAVMPLPYKEAGPGIFSIYQDIVTTGSRVAGAADAQVGEGKQDAPVGTTIALIEQATKVTDAVQKRLHSAQSKEFALLVDLFREYPEDFWRFNAKRKSQWNQEKLLKALNDYNLVPRADPNTSSKIQRIMIAQALYQMATQHPELFIIAQVLDYVLRVLGIRNPDAFVQPASNMAPPPNPADQAKLIQAQADQVNSQAKLADVQLRAKNLGVENQNKDADRAADLKIAAVKLQQEKLIHGQDLQQQRDNHHTDLAADMVKHKMGLQADLQQHMTGLASDHALAAAQQDHEQTLQANEPKPTASKT